MSIAFINVFGRGQKKIADSIYTMLSDKIGSFEVVLMKPTVSQERFDQLVRNVFDSSDRFFLEPQAHMDELFKKWKAANANDYQAHVLREKRL